MHRFQNQPTTNSVGFPSRTVGTRITLENHAEVVESDEVGAVAQEVGAALARVNAQIRLAGAERARTGRCMPHHQWAELQQDRAFLAPLHQALLHRRRQINEEERAERQRQEQDRRNSAAPTFDSIFRLICSRELDVTTYQRITLQTEIRHSAELQRHHNATPKSGAHR